MNQIEKCVSIETVRANIDRVDRQIVALLVERGAFVKQAARFKKDSDEVKAPQRVEQVIDRVTALAKELGGNAAVTECVYRAMISGFIQAELVELAEFAGRREDQAAELSAALPVGSGEA